MKHLSLEATSAISDLELAKLRGQLEESTLFIKVDLVTSDRVLPEYIARIQAERKQWFGR